jgi:succinate dehydrogenase flavin-adding protein (antitoxin of CptAB toxin-antitoxin module)
MESYKKEGSSKKKNSQKCGRILKWMCWRGLFEREISLQVNNT